jgi:predicted TPR repeat methyltransferase
MSQHEGHLGAVYEAKGIDDLKKLYDGWANTYEAQMAQFGYRHPTVCLALLTRHASAGATPILDVGAGTGLFGEWANIVGFPHIEALDLSDGMLAIARAKGCYKALHKLALGHALPFADGSFAAVVASGVFSTGHVGTEGLPELVRICRRGGVIVLTVKDTLWETGFETYVRALSGVRVVEETVPYVSMPGETGVIPSRGLVLKVG